MGNKTEKEVEKTFREAGKLITKGSKLIKIRMAEQGNIPDVSAEEAASIPWLYILYQLLKDRIKKPKAP